MIIWAESWSIDNTSQYLFALPLSIWPFYLLSCTIMASYYTCCKVLPVCVHFCRSRKEKTTKYLTYQCPLFGGRGSANAQSCPFKDSDKRVTCELRTVCKIVKAFCLSAPEGCWEKVFFKKANKQKKK